MFATAALIASRPTTSPLPTSRMPFGVKVVTYRS
jgi:hypothetical protein